MYIMKQKVSKIQRKQHIEFITLKPSSSYDRNYKNYNRKILKRWKLQVKIELNLVLVCQSLRIRLLYIHYMSSLSLKVMIFF